MYAYKIDNRYRLFFFTGVARIRGKRYVGHVYITLFFSSSSRYPGPRK